MYSNEICCYSSAGSGALGLRSWTRIRSLLLRTESFPLHSRVFFVLALILFALPVAALNKTQPLPDAPQPMQAVSSHSDSATIRQVAPDFGVERARRAPRLAKIILPNEQTVPLSAKEKFELAGKQQLRIDAFATQVLSAGWGQLIDSNPRYGTDKAGFGERLGAASLRQGSQSLFSDGVMATIFRQDPRYYIKGSGSIFDRVTYAAGRVVIGRSDTGNAMPNYSKIFGYAESAALTTTYYPAVSAGWNTTVKGYGISLLTAVLGNQLREFLPQAIHLLAHRDSKPQPAN